MHVTEQECVRKNTNITTLDVSLLSPDNFADVYEEVTGKSNAGVVATSE